MYRNLLLAMSVFLFSTIAAYADSSFHTALVEQRTIFSVSKNNVCKNDVVSIDGDIVTTECTLVAISEGLRRAGARVGQKSGSTSIINTQTGEITLRGRVVTDYCNEPITVYSIIKDVSQSDGWSVSDNGRGCKIPSLYRDDCSFARCGANYDTSGKTQSTYYKSQTYAVATFNNQQ